MPRAGRSSLSAVLATVCLIGPQPGAALAVTCADAPISARGEPSRFEWLAKTKARANWRRRVRLTPGLGPAFADWKMASNLENSCISGPAGSVCTLTAVPCRKP